MLSNVQLKHVAVLALFGRKEGTDRKYIDNQNDIPLFSKEDKDYWFDESRVSVFYRTVKSIGIDTLCIG